MVRLRRGTNLLANPTVELGNTGWTDSSIVENVADANTRSGSWRVKYSNNGTGGPNALSSEMPVTAGRTYYAALWTRATTGAGAMQLAIRWRDAGHVQITRDVLAIVVGPVPHYMLIAGTAVAPSGAVYAVIDYGENTSDTTANPWYFDDAEFSMVNGFPRGDGALPRLATVPKFPDAMSLWAMSGKGQKRAHGNMGRVWTETYPVLDGSRASVRTLLEALNRAKREGLLWEVQHPYERTLGSGYGTTVTSVVVQSPPNLVLSPEDFGSGNWAMPTNHTRVKGAMDPFGGTEAWTLTDNETAPHGGFTGSITAYTGDGEKAAAVYMKQGSAGTNFVGILANGSTFRHRVDVTWSGGVPSLSTGDGAGTLFPVEPVGGGWYRIGFTATGVLASDTNTVVVYPAGNFSTGTGSVIVFGYNTWNERRRAVYRGPSQPGPAGFAAGQVGSELYIRVGGVGATTAFLRAGDRIRVTGCPVVFDVLGQVDLDAEGGGRVLINPPIYEGQSPVDGATIALAPVYSAIIVGVEGAPLQDTTKYIDAGLTVTFREQPE